ncbi:unnamed protein product [Adineta steineri]|uniref:Uncharacterized protein n=1 Tax=Adineta steineri TaxID=433720 RepID=A0A819T0P7_9BILA|nr:unnamed protein product [Adineta steineri]
MERLQIIYKNNGNFEEVTDLVNETLRGIICACENNNVHQLETILQSIETVKLDRYLNAMMELYRSPTYLLTPLMFASIHGHSTIVRFLLENYSHYCIVDALNCSCDFNYESDRYEGYFYRQTALWLAVQYKHFSVVQILISLGKANVNHMADESEGKSWTPLGLACRDGQLEMVKYLIENGANLYNVDQNNLTSLMIACKYENYDVVQYLLSLDDINQHLLNAMDNNRSTALHVVGNISYRTVDRKLDIIKLLLEGYHAKIIKNNVGCTPLTIAGIDDDELVMNYYMNNDDKSWYTTLQIIDELELIGCYHLISNGVDRYSKSYEYFLRAMKLRYKDLNKPILKTNLLPPMEVYNYYIECQTIEELELIKDDPDRIMMQSLMIWERLSITFDFLNQFNTQALYYAKSKEYQRAVQLYTHACYLRINTQIDLHGYLENLKNCTKIMGKMIEYNKTEEIQFDILIKILELTGNKFLRIKDLRLVKDFHGNNDRFPWSANKIKSTEVYHIDQCLSIILNLIFIGIEILRYSGEKERERRRIIHQLVQQLLDSDYRTVSDNKTLLHLSLIPYYKDRWLGGISIVTTFPSLPVVKFLLSCRASVNAIDNDHYTPLHDFVLNDYKHFPHLQWIDIENLFKLLINSGAHLDAIAHGRTPKDCAKDTRFQRLFEMHPIQLHLKCICARLIQKEKIKYINFIPTHLQSFIEMH